MFFCINKSLKKLGKMYLKVFPHHQISKKPLEVRMGKGKGNVDHWVFNVKTGFASSPIIYLAGTGTSGSTNINQAGFRAGTIVQTQSSPSGFAQTFLQVQTTYVAIAAVGVGSPFTSEFDFDPNILGYNNRSVTIGSDVIFTSGASGTTNQTAQLIRVNDSGSVDLYSGSANTIYTYTLTAADMSSSVLNFIAQTSARD
jgi:hypothetical protein